MRQASTMQRAMICALAAVALQGIACWDTSNRYDPARCDPRCETGFVCVDAQCLPIKPDLGARERGSVDGGRDVAVDAPRDAASDAPPDHAAVDKRRSEGAAVDVKEKDHSSTKDAGSDIPPPAEGGCVTPTGLTLTSRTKPKWDPVTHSYFVACNYTSGKDGGALNQCQAKAACSTSWSLCTLDNYNTRITGTVPSSYEWAWLAGCLRNGTVHLDYVSACTSCVGGTGSLELIVTDCSKPDGGPYLSTSTQIGVVSNYNNEGYHDPNTGACGLWAPVPSSSTKYSSSRPISRVLCCYTP
jgi:hypothetical protein